MSRPLHIDDFAGMAPAAGLPVQSPTFDGPARRLAYLRPRAGTDLLDLVLHDLASGAERVLLQGQPAGARSLPDRLARERARQRYDGVTHARWLPGRSLLYSLQGAAVVFVDADSGAVHRVQAPAHVDSAEALSDGQALVIACAGDLWRLPVEGGALQRLTGDGSAQLLHGQPDPVTTEEVFNGAAYTTSADGQQLLLASFHVAAVDEIPVPGATQPVPETSRYGRPGAAVATFSVSLMPAQGGARRVLLEADPVWPYFLGFSSRNDDEAVLLRLKRDQTALQWWRIRWADGQMSLLLEQTQRPWINAPGKTVWRDDGSFLLVHEQQGEGRIGLYDAQGRWQRDIGAETGHVESLVGADAAGQGVWFVATGGDARERHVYHAAPADGWAARRLSTPGGVHGATLGRKAGLVVMHADRLDARPTTRLLREDGSELRRFETPAPAYEERLVVPRLVDAPAADGTPLHAALYEPAGPGPHPVVLLVYGGPHGQAVRRTRSLMLDLRAQWLAACGYLVVKIDNRGTNARGHAFEAPLYGRMGTVEVDDQVAALQHLLAGLPSADASRIGVVGWSYGGYMALRCLQRRADVFRCAIAGAPVVDWCDYDAPYTERYMGTPRPLEPFEHVNAEGYRTSSVDLSSVAPWRPLMLIHGLNDENVLFRHSAALMERLAAQRLPYELLLLPDERHAVRAPHQRSYLEFRIQEFFDRNLRTLP